MTAPVVLKCPACGSALAARDLDPDRHLARCSHCGALMSLSPPHSGPGDFRARPPVPLPPGLHLTERPDGLEIRRRWFTPSVLLLGFFCIFWDGFLLFWYAIAFTTGAPWIMKVFPLLHVAVGIGLTYTTLASLFNTTRLRLTWNDLSIVHSPVPWPGQRTVPRHEIEQLYCRRFVHHRHDSGPTTRYEVWIKTTDGRANKLLGAGLDETQALFVEQRIERALGLADRPIAGELER